MADYFFTPVYSSTVFVVMVTTSFPSPVTPSPWERVWGEVFVKVAVVLIVRHALQLVMPTATQTIAANINKSLFIVLLVFWG